MGQQQLLLAILSVILVGIAIIVGINLFSASAAQANLEAVINDVLSFGARAQQYYVKPVMMGGGGYSFNRITIQDVTAKTSNENGTYSIRKRENAYVELFGVGLLDGDGDGDNCEVLIKIFPDSVYIDIEKL
jgi:hypothetical protein